MNEEDKRLYFLIESRYDALSKIKHPWNELMLLSDEDLETIGPWPGFEKYKGQVDFRVCDKDKMFDFLFQRLVNVEPLFAKISDAFKERIKTSILFAMDDRNSREKGYKNPFFWTTVYYFLRGGYRISGFDPTENENDFLLWNKIDIKDYLLNEIIKIAGDQTKEIDYLFKKNNSTLCSKIEDSNKKYYNNTNKKVS